MNIVAPEISECEHREINGVAHIKERGTDTRTDTEDAKDSASISKDGESNAHHENIIL